MSDIRHTISVEGMGCQSCVKKVGELLRSIEGVSEVRVDLAGRAAEVIAARTLDGAVIQELFTATKYRVELRDTEPLEHAPVESPAAPPPSVTWVGDEAGVSNQVVMEHREAPSEIVMPPLYAPEVAPASSVGSTASAPPSMAPAESVTPSVSASSSAPAASGEVGRAVAAPPSELVFEIEGMHCASCVARVESALKRVEGVAEARVNLATARATVELVAGASKAAVGGAVSKAATAAGYKATTLDAGDEAAAHEASRARRAVEVAQWKRRWIIGAILTVPIAVVQMGPMLVAGFPVVPGAPLLALTLGTLAMLLVGLPFLAGAWRSLLHAEFTMDTLVALGTGTAYVWSVWLYSQAASHGGHIHLHVEEVGMILTLVSLGKWMETRARLNAGDALRQLLELRPSTARVEREGREIEVPVDALQVGDVMVVRPGERLAADGTVTEGASEVDESLVTGESIPVRRQQGDSVVGGSVNGSGLLRVEISRLGAQSFLGQVVREVERAQEGKADIQRLVDRVSAVFVPVVMLVALATLLGWAYVSGQWSMGIPHAVAVLIVACPCAMGLATPMALMVGSALGARSGILLRDVRAIEHVGGLDTIIFDKTGTLTLGRPSLVEAVPLVGDLSREDFLALAATAELASEHPLGRAIAGAAQQQGIRLGRVESSQNHPGRGIEARLKDGPVIHAGAPDWVLGMGATLPQAAIGWIEEREAEGCTAVLVAGTPPNSGLGPQLLGLCLLRDEPRPGARAAVADLSRRLGMTPWMVTGDAEPTALSVAHDVGIPPEQVIARARPADKAAHVRSLRSRGRRTAMVGDGINDAPALAEADLGIAMGSGTDIARETGSIVLMNSDPAAVVRAVDLSRATLRTIRQNLFWAFAYNTLLIPAAAFGLLMPAFAAAAMALSSVSVVGNSRALAWRVPAPPTAKR